MSDQLDSVRVIDKRTVLLMVGLSEDTFDRLDRCGDGPPVTRLSERRKGYRLVDVMKWLDARRQGDA